MRHKYATRGIVLARSHTGEATTFLTILTSELGLVYARAQSLRVPKAKLASALATYAESSLLLVRGKESWRIAGAVLEENWFAPMNTQARAAAARVSGLLLRLVAGEVCDPKLFSAVIGFFKALATLPKDVYEAVEILVVLRVLTILGFDAGEIPGEISAYTPAVLAQVIENRTNYIARINRGIAVSGL